MKLKALLVGVVLASAFTSANALTVLTGNVPQIDDNLVFNGCGLPPGAGNPVFGCLNNNHSAVVTMSSDETIVISGGQAVVGAVDGLYSTLTIALNPLNTVILNIDASVDGVVTFTDGSGTSGAFALDDNGTNIFTLTGITGNFLTFRTSVNGVETDMMTEVLQIRLGGPVAAIPEPETYALIMAGLATIGFIGRRRKTRK